MEILLLGIYAIFVWLVFFKFRWLPWNITSQVIVVTIPIIGLTALILILNVVAPSSHDVRVINYVVPVNPRVSGLVTEVPVEPNRPIKKGDVLFRIDSKPFEIAVQNAEAELARLRVELISAAARAKNLAQQLRSTQGQLEAIDARLKLARQRVDQFRELAESGAGNRFDYEQALTEQQDLEAQRLTALASEAQARENLAAKTPEGEQDEVARVRAQIVQAEAELADAPPSISWYRV